MREERKKPEIIVFAGPNGSGKSTITQTLRPVDTDYINADEIQKAMHCANLQAAQIAERLREEHLEAKKDFCSMRRLWLKEDIRELTGIEKMESSALNIRKLW